MISEFKGTLPRLLREMLNTMRDLQKQISSINDLLNEHKKEIEELKRKQ